MLYETKLWQKPEHSDKVNNDMLGIHKFVALQGSEDRITSIFPFLTQHREMVRKVSDTFKLNEREAFLGAGQIKKIFDSTKVLISFGSDSCLDSTALKGKDRPEEIAEQLVLIDQIKSALRELGICT